MSSSSRRFCKGVAAYATGFVWFLASGNLVLADEKVEVKSIELGTLIAMLIPAPESKITWEHGIESGIEWTTSGFDEVRQANGDRIATRNGHVVVNVLGKTSTVLRKKVELLPWTVSMRTSEPAKFGPNEIHIFPGTPEESCFGTLYSGCDFEAEPSVKNADIASREICQFKEFGDSVKAYELRRRDGSIAYLIQSSSGGSGGVSTELTLVFSSDRARAACVSSSPT